MAQQCATCDAFLSKYGDLNAKAIQSAERLVKASQETPIEIKAASRQFEAVETECADLRTAWLLHLKTHTSSLALAAGS